jgi:hypothetical protein
MKQWTWSERYAWLGGLCLGIAAGLWPVAAYSHPITAVSVVAVCAVLLAAAWRLRGDVLRGRPGVEICPHCGRPEGKP